MHEKCGVVGVVDLAGKQNVVPIAAQIAHGLDHRGQRGAGIAWYDQHAKDGESIKVYKDLGSVTTVLDLTRLEAMGICSSAAIAHTRYATDTNLTRDHLHPAHITQRETEELGHTDISMAWAFNGNIADYATHEVRLRKRGHPPRIDSDTEVIGQTILAAMKKHQRHRWRKVLQELDALDGSYNVVILREDGTVSALRDKHGFRPLSYARDGSLVLIASEDSAIRSARKHIPNRDFHNIKPGFLLSAAPDQEHARIKPEQLWVADRSLCFFELVYFANHRSRIDGISVSNVRYECGKILAEQDNDLENTDDLIVVPVPQSALTAAHGYANTKHLREIHAILVDGGQSTNSTSTDDKEEHGVRTFIGATEQERIHKAEKKYRDIKEQFVRDMSLVLVEDSLVRGTTMRTLVGKLREKGARHIHLRLACPPIMAPCFYGIDFPTVKELLARKYTHAPLSEGEVLPDDVLQAIAEDIGVDSIRYLPVSAIPRALGRKPDEICMACVTGEYPTPGGQELYQIAEARWNKAKPPQSSDSTPHVR